MNKETPDNVLRRVQKLMAIANDTRADPNEAASAAAHAANIMQKYQIEEADVIFAALKNSDELSEEIMQPRLAEWNEPQRRIPKWANLFAAKIGEFTGARPVIGQVVTKYGIEPAIKFQGYSSDVKVSVYMMEFLQQTMRRLRTEFKTGFTYQTKGVTSLRSYTEGLTLGILDVLDIEIKKRKAEEIAENTASTSTALVVAKLNAIIDKYGTTKSGGTYAVGDVGDGFEQGIKDGQAVSIKPAVSAPPPENQLSLPNLG